MNASQLTMIKEAKRLLEDCSCFRGPEGPPGSNGSTIVGPIGPTGPQGPPGTLSSFSIVGASTNALLYYDGNKPAGISSLFYYSTTNVLQANLDIIPCTDTVYSLGSSNAGRWKDLFLGPSSLYLGYKAKVYEDVYGNVTTDTGYSAPSMSPSTINIGNLSGYQISVNNNDLFAQQYNSTGPNGTLYPILHPIGYISCSQLTSTIDGLGTIGYISTSQLLSSITGLGNIYVSSTQLQSTVNGLALIGYISTTQLTSSIVGTQNIFVSSLSLASTTQAIENNILSTNTGLGALGYVSSLQLVSTVSGIDNTLIVIQNGLASLGYLSTTQLISTVNGLGSLYVSTSQLTSTTTGLENMVLSTINTTFPSTIIGLGTFGYISSSQLTSSFQGVNYIIQPETTSTIVGLGTFGYISSLDGFFPSTITGLGTFGYISSYQLVSSFQGVNNIIQPETTSTITGLGTFGYISTSALTSTIVGLGTIGYISCSQLTSTVTGLGDIYVSSLDSFFPSTVNGLGNIYLSTIFTAPSTTQAIISTTTGLGNIYVSSIINNAFGKILRVDSLYGNDNLALTNQYSFPFSTISCAMYCASTQDQIYLLPGTYNECVTFKPGVNIRGVNLNSVVIQQSNVIQPTTLITMASNNRLEDITLSLTSKTTTASTLIGVLFSSCQDTCKLRACVLNVNNSGLTDNTRPNNVYGIYSAGYSSTIYTTNDNAQRTSITVTSAGNGTAHCIYNNNSNRFTMRDVNLFCTDAYNPAYTGGSYIGIETTNSNSVVQIKNSSVNGNAYNNGNTSADISQTKGQIIVGFTDLVNKTANNNSFTVNGTQSIISFGISGALSNFIQFTTGGPIPNTISNNWSNSFLVPGTLSFTTVNADIITSYNGIRIANTNVITTFGVQAQMPPGNGISSFTVLYKNGAPLANFVLPLTGLNSSFYLSTSTVTIKTNDSFGIFMSTSSSNTGLSNVVISANFF